MDDPANEAMFAKMEELGMLAASLNIADPNGPFGNLTPWCIDLVEYWREIAGLYNVLNRHLYIPILGFRTRNPDRYRFLNPHLLL